MRSLITYFYQGLCVPVGYCLTNIYGSFRIVSKGRDNMANYMAQNKQDQINITSDRCRKNRAK
jgi:hypothetical protein